MKNTFKFFVTLFLLAVVLNTSKAQVAPEFWPTFTMTAKNITMQPNPTFNQDSIVFWDVYILQTNYGQPGIQPFEFCCAQYNWYYNKNIVKPNGGNLVLTNLGAQTDLPTALRPPTFQVDSNSVWAGQDPSVGLLKTSGNLPNSSVNFFIGNQFPGTKALRMKLTTNGKQFKVDTLNLRWRGGPTAPNTFLAYFAPNPPGPDSANPQYAQSLLDSAGVYFVENGNIVLPVELASFVSTVNKNNVELNWSTATETNNQMFEIERSISNSNEWTKVGEVQGNGTTTEVKNYKYNDRGVTTGHYTYRLKQIDFNGTANYHELSAEVIVGVPTAYAISQNYPNPFNPTTKIDYELPYDGKVSILLYDISGREVAKLVNEVKTAGYYTAQFNGANLASGMYFYRINAEGSGQNFVTTKKMVLIK
jgi:hypothetical protein